MSLTHTTTPKTRWTHRICSMRVTTATLCLFLAAAVGCKSDDRGTANDAGGAAGVVGGAAGTSAGFAASGTGGTLGAAGSAGTGGVGGTSGASGSTGSGSGGSYADAGELNDGSAGAAGTAADGGGDASTGLTGWTLTFSDEFDGPSGSAVDASKWNMVDKGDGFGNNELEFYRSGTSNAAMDGQGSLVITAKKETYSGRDYTSAKLESSGKFDQKYGRMEARLKLPKGQGIWPAFWMLGKSDNGCTGWPDCGEIDIMENIGREPTIVHGSLHGPGYSGGNPLSGSYTLPNGAKFADDFHVFAVEWEPNVVRFYVDEQLYETHTPSDVSGKKWVYDHNFYLIMNVAVGGQWPGNPDQSTTFPQTMTVDYVRVYER